MKTIEFNDLPIGSVFKSGGGLGANDKWRT